MAKNNKSMPSFKYIAPYNDNAVQIGKKLKDILFAYKNKGICFEAYDLRIGLLEPDGEYPGLNDYVSTFDEKELIIDIKGFITQLANVTILKALSKGAKKKHHKYTVNECFEAQNTYTHILLDIIRKRANPLINEVTASADNERNLAKESILFLAKDLESKRDEELSPDDRLSKLFLKDIEKEISLAPAQKMTENISTKTADSTTYDGYKGRIVAEISGDETVKIGRYHKDNGAVGRLDYIKANGTGKKILIGTLDYLELKESGKISDPVINPIPVLKEEFIFLMYCTGIRNYDELQKYVPNDRDWNTFFIKNKEPLKNL